MYKGSIYNVSKVKGKIQKAYPLLPNSQRTDMLPLTIKDNGMEVPMAGTFPTKILGSPLAPLRLEGREGDEEYKKV